MYYEENYILLLNAISFAIIDLEYCKDINYVIEYLKNIQKIVWQKERGKASL